MRSGKRSKRKDKGLAAGIIMLTLCVCTGICFSVVLLGPLKSFGPESKLSGADQK